MKQSPWIVGLMVAISIGLLESADNENEVILVISSGQPKFRAKQFRPFMGSISLPMLAGGGGKSLNGTVGSGHSEYSGPHPWVSRTFKAFICSLTDFGVGGFDIHLAIPPSWSTGGSLNLKILCYDNLDILPFISCCRDTEQEQKTPQGWGCEHSIFILRQQMILPLPFKFHEQLRCCN